METVIALAIMAVVFATIIPLFRQIRSNWDAREASAEVLQSGRVLMDHLNRNFATATRIIDVGASDQTLGHVEFLASDGNTPKYDVNAAGYVVYDVINTDRVAGPVTQFRLTCYDANDFNTPTTDANVIRLVKLQVTVANPEPLAEDVNFATSIYLRARSDANDVNDANSPEGIIITTGTPFEFDTSQGRDTALAQIDATHYLCTYCGPGSDGFAVVLAVDTTTGTITKPAAAFEFETVDCYETALAKIDDTHYLCAYRGPSADGFAVVLTANTVSWTISKGAAFEYDTSDGYTPALSKIDSTHYLCAYRGRDSDGWSAVLIVDPATWVVTKGTPYEFDTANGQFPALAQIDPNHYLCAYSGNSSRGYAVVLDVNTADWAITKGTAYQHYSSATSSQALARIDSTHYLCTYTGSGSDGYAVVLIVNPSTWAITKGTAYTFDPYNGYETDLAQISQYSYICAYRGPDDTGGGSVYGRATILDVNSIDWQITEGDDVMFDSTAAYDPALAIIDPNNFLCAYEGPDLDGWSVILELTEPNEPPPPPPPPFMP